MHTMDRPSVRKMKMIQRSPLGVSAISSHLIIAQKMRAKKKVAKAYTSLSTALNQTESRKVQVSAPTTGSNDEQFLQAIRFFFFSSYHLFSQAGNDPEAEQNREEILSAENIRHDRHLFRRRGKQAEIRPTIRKIGAPGG